MLVVSIATEQEATGLVSVARYRALSGDTVTEDDAVVSALTEAVNLVEEYLRRKLSLGEHTESQVPNRGYLYPSCTPVTAVPANYVLEGRAIRVSPIPLRPKAVSFTYTGGYTAATLPSTLALAVVITARDLTNALVATQSAPYGAKSVSVGDVSVTYADGAGAGVGGLSSRIQRSIRQWRVKNV